MSWVSRVINSEQEPELDAPNLSSGSEENSEMRQPRFDTMNSCPRGHPGAALLQDELRVWIYGVWVPCVGCPHHLAVDGRWLCLCGALCVTSRGDTSEQPFSSCAFPSPTALPAPFCGADPENILKAAGAYSCNSPPGSFCF